MNGLPAPGVDAIMPGMRSRSLGVVLGVLLLGAGLAWAKAPEWLETGSSDGKRVWYVPEGWTAAKGVDEEVGDTLIYNSSDGYGEYMVQGLAKSRGETCPGVVEAATKGKKGKAVKGVLCAENKSGEQVI